MTSLHDAHHDVMGVGGHVGWERNGLAVAPMHPMDYAAELIRKIREEAQVQAPRLRPFVLKCPNCIAPIASGVTSCDFCGVPYVWEPAVSLSRDDNPMRDPSWWSAPEPPEVAEIVRGFGPTMVHASCTSVISMTFEGVFRPTKLWVDESYRQAFAIVDVRVGKDSVRYGDESIPARACSVGEGLDVFSGQTLGSGQQLQIHVANLTASPANIHGLVRGTRIGANALKRLR